MEDISVKARKIDVEPSPRPKQRQVSKGDELEVERPEELESDDMTAEGAEGSDYEPFGETPDVTPDDNYPTPRPRREKIRLSVFEMGMIGIGIVIFIFAIISFVNLISK